VNTLLQQSPITRWLLDSDPAIRWQVLRDVLDAPAAVYEPDRMRLPQSGWCARLLHLQEKSGLWGGSLYAGKWTSTTYTLYLLKLMGLTSTNEPACRACGLLLADGLHAGSEIRFNRDREIRDLGITALVLSLCCHFDQDAEALHNIMQLLMSEQRHGGEWLPDDQASAEDYAFETTLLVLEAICQYRDRYPDRETTALEVAVEGGRDFLLRHNLFLRDGQPIKAGWMTFSFPPYWFYDVLTALDHFRAACATRDERLLPAINLLRTRCRPDGKWTLGSPHPGKMHFPLEESGQPSRWNTLRAMRILHWWDGL